MTINEIRDAITTLFNFTITDETDEKIVFNIISDKTAILDKVQVTQLIQELSVMTTDQDVELTDNISLEVLVRQENRMMLNSQRVFCSRQFQKR